MGYTEIVVGRALMHGMFVALVVVLAIAKPDLSERRDAPWLDEVCASYDICDDTPSEAGATGR